MKLHNRQIKAEFLTDPELLEWHRDKRWFYEGLIQLADDSGCLEDSPFSFKLEIFKSPLDADITVEVLSQWRDELLADGKSIRYQVGRKNYLFLTKFHKHQTLKNPQAPSEPLPPWIEWKPYQSNQSSGKYIINYDILSTFLGGSYDDLSTHLPSSEDRLAIEFKSIQENLNQDILQQQHAHAREDDASDDETKPPKTVVGLYEQYFGHLANTFLTDKISLFVTEDGMDIDLIELAFRRCREAGNSFQYAQGILKQWRQKGIQTVDQAEEEQKNWEEAKNSGTRGSVSISVTRTNRDDEEFGEVREYKSPFANST